MGKTRWLILACVIVLVGGLVGWHNRAHLLKQWQGKGKAISGQGVGAADSSAGPSSAVPVVTQQVRQRRFEAKVVTWGTVRAKRFALVSARVPGTLNEIFVDEGDYVEAGKTRLFQTDPVKLQKAVGIAEKALKVAEASLAEKHARLEQAVAEKNQLERDLARYRKLAAEKAFPEQKLEQAEMRFVQAQAAIKDILALIRLNEAQVEQARYNLEIARKDLADSLVYAPISGVVTNRLKEPGEMADVGTPVVRIEDPTLLEVCTFVPGELYGKVRVGETQMRVLLEGEDKPIGTYVVSYKSPRINEKLRTFEVRALIHSPPPTLVSGAMVRTEIVWKTSQGLGVPTEAISQRANGEVVFVIQNGTARRVSIRRRLEAKGWVEVISDELKPGMNVAIKGVDLLTDGAAVTVVEEPRQ